MRNKQGYTPKELAISLIYDQIYDWLKYGNMEDFGPPSFIKEVRKHMINEGNRLLEKVNLDATPLPEE